MTDGTSLKAVEGACAARDYGRAAALCRLILAAGPNAEASSWLAVALARSGDAAGARAATGAAFAAGMVQPSARLPPAPYEPAVFRFSSLYEDAQPLFYFSTARLLVPDRPGHALRPAAYALRDVIIDPAVEWAPITSDGAVLLAGAVINPRIATEAFERRCAAPPVIEEHDTDRLIVIGSSRNYYHFLLDYLPRLLTVVATGLLGDGWRLALPAGCPFMAEALRLLRVPSRCCIALDPERQHRFRQAVVLSNAAGFGNLHPQAVPLLCRLFRDAALAGGSRASGRWLYLSRRDAAYRRVVNDDEIFAALQPLGFERVEGAALDVAGQVALFAGASVIVGPHGAGLTNMLWTPEGARLVELAPPAPGIEHFRYLCQALGRPYTVLVARPEDSATLGDSRADFRIDPKTVLDALQGAGAWSA